jgi:hypothetical protein
MRKVLKDDQVNIRTQGARLFLMEHASICVSPQGYILLARHLDNPDFARYNRFDIIRRWRPPGWSIHPNRPQQADGSLRTCGCVCEGAFFSPSHCPIRMLLQTSTEERPGCLFHENVNDPGVREGSRSAMGYYFRHAADSDSFSMRNPGDE